MNILTPPRIESLGSQSIRVIVHTKKGTSTWSLKVYPFETITSVKQRIALHTPDTRAFLPAAVFLAQKAADGYRPVEFRWDFAATVADPLQETTPRTELMEGDVRKPVFPTLLQGLTVEAVGMEELHVWSIQDVAKGVSLDPLSFGGFLQFYFPLLEKPVDVDALLSEDALTAAEKESLEAMQLFQERFLQRLGKIEGFLQKGPGPTLQELRALRIQLPRKAAKDKESLELRFHAMKPTRGMPILRFFSAQQRVPPLLKLATGPTGIPTIADSKLLRALLGDVPTTVQGALLLGKAPLIHPKAPFGAAWVLRMYEDGGAELVLGAPRRDAPLMSAVVATAFQELPAFLQGTPWTVQDIAEGSLTELTATYEYTLQQDIRKPSKTELRKRAEPFLNLYKEEAIQTGDAAALTLRWKAVSNFVAERDPVMSYITDLFLRDAFKTVDTIPIGMYVGAIAREFGLGPKEAGAALNTWISRHAEYVLADPDAPEKAAAAHGLGAFVSVYNMHPSYRFYLAGVESYKDLQRILSTLIVWVSHTAQELVGDATVVPVEEEAPPVPAEPEIPAVDEGQMEEWYQAMEMYGMMEEGEGDVGEDIAMVQEQQPQPQQPQQPQQQPGEVLELQKDVRYPEPLGPDEQPIPSMKEYLIKQLKAHDKDLFGYTSQNKNEVFARTCQASSNKQPQVMSPEAYRRIRSFYGDKVHWVEAPLSKYDTEALFVASRKVGERFKKFKARRVKKDGETEEQIQEELVALEKRALRLGFPLKDGKSAISEDAEFVELKAVQGTKPLWIVTRAGTAKPNYYICSEYWCIRDDLPIIPKITKDAAGEDVEACPFCGGRVIQDKLEPAKGETVLKRGPTGKGQPVAKYAGYLNNLFHPDGFIIPCCFTDPDNLAVKPEGKPIPPPLVELPKIQQDTPPVEEVVEKEVVVATKNIMDVFDDVKIKMEYTPKLKGLEEKFRFMDKEKTKVELMGKRILRTYILEASNFPLEVGKVGLLPPAFDVFLGQDRKQYLENPKHGEIYTHPEVKGRGFFRLGMGIKQRNMGSMIPQLIAYAGAAVSHIVPPLVAEAASVEDVLRDLFETREVLAFHAFQQANYGTLPAEFADPDRPVADGVFQAWCGKMGIPLPAQRAHGLALYRAWLQYQDAMRDSRHRKDLRLWTHMFAAPGLFSTTGVILAVLTTDENGHVVLRCPPLGIPQRQQWVKPPLLLLFEDRKTQMVEPLVLYDGPDKLLGVLDPDSTTFGSLHPSLRTPLAAFYSEYFDPAGGCGRPEPVLHSWITDDATQGGLPPVGSLLYILRNQPEFTTWQVEAFVRDRTRRLVGLRIGVDEKSVLVPAVDDGTIDVEVRSLYDEEAIPYPPLSLLLQVLVGGREEGLAAYFRGLRPVERRTQDGFVVALEVKGGCMIPMEPVRTDAAIGHPVYASLRGDIEVEELPWIAMQPREKEASPFLQNAEVQLEEAYQHLRLSVAEHLQTTEGQGLRRQIEAVRASPLPLFEKRRRMDLLLETFRAWIHVGKKGDTWDISALRRNCLKLPEGECTESCAWMRGSCMIHAVPTERFVDPAFVLLARLGDELLRTYGPAQQVLESKVSRLRPPTGIVREKGSMMLAVEGRGDDEMYRALGLESRLPTRYTHGITIPEEMGEADVGCEESHRGIPLTWVGVVPMVWPAAAVGQSLREIAWAAILGNAWKEMEGLPEKEMYEAVAKQGMHVLLTTNACGGYKLAHWFASEGNQYIVLDPRRIPLASEKTKKPIFQEKELPSAIRQWMDESKRGVGIAEEIKEAELFEEAEEEEPYMRLEKEEETMLEQIPLDAIRLDGIELALCLKAKNNPRFPFRSEELVEALQEEGFKIGKNAPRERICKFVTEKTLRIILRKRMEKGELPKPVVEKPAALVEKPTDKPVEPKEPVVELKDKSPAPVLTGIQLERCNPKDGFHPTKFPFKRPELIEELRSRKIKIPLNATLERICPHVTTDVLQAILQKRGKTQKNRKAQEPPQQPQEPQQQPQPQQPPQEPQEDEEPLPVNLSKIQIDKCSKGYAKQFPFKRPELIEALREQGIRLPKAATLDKVCPRVTEETLRHILRKKAMQTRKNKNQPNKPNKPNQSNNPPRMEIVEEE